MLKLDFFFTCDLEFWFCCRYNFETTWISYWYSEIRILLTRSFPFSFFFKSNYVSLYPSWLDRTRRVNWWNEDIFFLFLFLSLSSKQKLLKLLLNKNTNTKWQMPHLLLRCLEIVFLQRMKRNFMTSWVWLG
jgi:hypothetical protein